MKTKHLIIICAGLAAATFSCTGDGIGPATSPIDPFAQEPASGAATGDEPTGGTSLVDLCVAACANINRACPGSESPDCPNDCATSSPPGCEALFRAFVQCLATAPLQCVGTSIDPTPCLPQLSALDNCDNGGGMSGGTGSGGAAGTR